MILLRAEVSTDLVDDCFIIPMRDQNATVQWLLIEILKKYHDWHPFKIYEFEIEKLNAIAFAAKGVDADRSLLSLMEISPQQFASKTVRQHIVCRVAESAKSRQQRKEDEERAEQLRLERLRIEKEKAEKRRKRIAEISLKGNCWELENYSQFLNVPLDEGGQIVDNTGSLDQWVSIRFMTAILPSFNKFFVSFAIAKLPPTTNTWRICIGAVPIEFKIEADRHWIGSQHSWSYIAGTGGKCHNSGKSIDYGDEFAQGDVISVLLDFDNHCIEFFKNGKSQGVAFKDLKGAVIPGISLTAKGCRIEILDLVNDSHLPAKYRPFMVKNVEILRNYVANRQRYLSDGFAAEQTRLWQQRQNSLSPRFSGWRHPPSLYYRSTKAGDVDVCSVVANNGSGDKWRVARTFGAYRPDPDPDADPDSAADSDVDVAAFEFAMLCDGKSSNTWRVCVGVVPLDFDGESDKVWVGAQSSWAYIAGTGGVCHNTSQSTAYGERFGEGDTVSVLLDFKALSIEFFKNGESQGVAFSDCEALRAGVYGAVSMTAATASVQLRSLSPSRARQLRILGAEQRSRLERVMSEFGNVWDANKMSSSASVGNGLRLALSASDKLCLESTWKANGARAQPKKESSRWKAAASLVGYQTGRRYFEMVIVAMPSAKGSSKWKMCVGVVPKSFNFAKGNKQWIGAQSSWALIVGTGGKCHNTSKSLQYCSESFAVKDRIGVLMDFDNHTLEFYRNDKSLGEAFNNLYGPVFAAVSFASSQYKVRFRPQAEAEKMDSLFLFH